MPSPRPPLLSYRSIMGLFAVAALLLAGAGYAVFRHQMQQVGAERYEELTAIGQLKAGQIAAWRGERLGDARLHARAPFRAAALEQWLQRPDDALLRQRLALGLALVRETYGYRSAMIAAPGGELLLADGDSADGLTEASRSLIAAAAASTEALAGDFYVLPATGDVVLEVAAAMGDSPDRQQAVLLLRVSLEHGLLPLIRLWSPRRDSAQTFLVHRDGGDALVLGPLRSYGVPAAARREPLAGSASVEIRAARGEVGRLDGHDLRGSAVLADARPVAESGWVLLTIVDDGELRAVARRRGAVIAGIGAAGIAAAALLLGAAVVVHRRRYFEALYRAEREQREMLEESRATLRSIGDAVISTDAEGRVRQMNPVAEALTGWLESDARQQPLAEVFRLIDEATREAVASPLAGVLRDGRAAGLEEGTLLIARDGSQRPIADSTAPVRDAQGAIIGAVLVFRDLTAERAAQRRLATVEQRFRATFEQAAVGMSHTAIDGRLLEVNRKLCEIVGYSRAELLARTWQDITHADDLQADLHRVRRLLAGEFSSYTLEKRYLRRDGGSVWIDLTVTLVRSADGTPEYFVSVVEDISARRRADEALRASEARYRLLFSRNPQPMYVYDLETLRFLAVNEAAVAHYGYSADEFLGMTIKDIRPPEDVPELLQRVGRSADGLGRSGIWRHRLKDGRLIQAEISTYTISIDGRPARLVLATDVTQRLAAEELLRASEANLARAQRIAQLGSWELDPASGRLRWSAEMYRIMGLPAGRPIDLESASAQIHADDRGRLAALHQRAQQGELISEVEFRIVRPDGSVRWVQASAETERDGDGRIRRLTGVLIDVTARVEADEKIRAQLRELQRWRAVTLDREERVQALKQEVNDLLREAQRPARYAAGRAGEGNGARPAAGPPRSIGSAG